MRRTALSCLAVAVGLRAGRPAAPGRSRAALRGAILGCSQQEASAVPWTRALPQGCSHPFATRGPLAASHLPDFVVGRGSCGRMCPRSAVLLSVQVVVRADFLAPSQLPDVPPQAAAPTWKQQIPLFFLRTSQAVLLALSACGTRPWHNCQVPAQPGFGRNDTVRRRGYLSVTF